MLLGRLLKTLSFFVAHFVFVSTFSAVIQAFNSWQPTRRTCADDKGHLAARPTEIQAVCVASMEHRAAVLGFVVCLLCQAVAGEGSPRSTASWHVTLLLELAHDFQKHDQDVI